MDLSVQLKGRPGSKNDKPGIFKDLLLSAGQLYDINIRKAPVRVQCLEGVLWVTRENDPADYLLQRCQAAVFAKGGKLIIQSLAQGKIRIQSN